MRLAAICLAFLALVGVVPARAQSPEEQLAAASALFEARKYAEAAQKLEVFVTQNPKHAKVGPAALALGRCYTELKQFPKAIPAYEKAVATKDPAILSSAQLGLGEAAMQSSQYPKAIEALSAAVKNRLQPDQAAVAWYWLGQANYQLEKLPAAEEAYLKVIQDFPKAEFVDAAYFGAGLAAMRQDKNDVARTRLKTLIDRFPKSEDRPSALVVLAQLDLREMRYREARAGFEAALADPVAKADAELKNNAEQGLARALLELQDYPAAAARLEAILPRLAPNDPQRFRAYLSLGHCRYRQKQYEAALAAYKETAKSIEGEAAGEGHYWTANTLLALNRPAEAAPEFAKVMARFPQFYLAPKAQLRAGDAYLAAKQTDQATAAYRLVIEKFPQSAEAGEARKALGDAVLAINDPVKLAQALKTAPPAERAKGTLRLARLYLEGKKYAEAEVPLTELLKGKPEPGVAAEGQYLLGLAYEAQEKAAPAATAFAAAVQMAGAAEWAADAHGRLAWLYLELKQPANAERAADAVLGLKPGAEAERQALLARVQAQLDQDKLDAAAAGCRQLLAGNPPAETVATVLYTQAWISEKQGKPADALPVWEKIATQYRQSPHAAEALLHLGDASLKDEKYEDARARYAALVKDYSTSPLLPEARFKLGSSLYNLEKYPEATAEFDAVVADKNAADWLPEALYWSGVAYEKAGKKEVAVQRLSRLVMQFPKHMRVGNAKLRLAALKAVIGK